MSCLLRATRQENGAFRGERAVSPQSPSAIDLRPRGLRYLVRGLVRYWITHTLRPPFGAACAVPTVDGSFRHAQASPSALRVRHEPLDATGDDGAASAVCTGGEAGLAGVGAGAVVDGEAGVVASGAGPGAGAGVVAAGGDTGGVAAGGVVCAKAIVAAADSATATAIPSILFMRHLKTCS